MSSRFHSKHHRHNHHTDPSSDPRYPDSAHDPIASPDSPFLGPFVLQGVLSANSVKETHSAKISHDTDTALILDSPKWALYVEDGSTLVKDITCNNIFITNSFTIQTAVIFGGDMQVNGNTLLNGELTVGKSLRVDSNTFFVNSTSNKVGVNTLVPNADLTVVGDISGTGKINVSNGVFSGPGFFYNPSLTNFYTNSYTKIDNSLDVLTNVSLSGSLIANSDASIKKDLTVAGNVLYVSSVAGRVGVNTTTPAANLHIVGNALVSQNLTVSNNVGIGTNVPNKQLTVTGEISAVRHLNIGQKALYVNTDYNYVSINADIPPGPWPFLPSNTLAVNGTLSAAGDAFIDGNARVKGNVGINTLTPNKTLTVTGDISATGAIFANSFSLQTLDIKPTNLTLTSQLSTFTTPVTATGDFLLLNVNGTTRAVRLWNF